MKFAYKVKKKNVFIMAYKIIIIQINILNI